MTLSWFDSKTIQSNGGHFEFLNGQRAFLISDPRGKRVSQLPLVAQSERFFT